MCARRSTSLVILLSLASCSDGPDRDRTPPPTRVDAGARDGGPLDQGAGIEDATIDGGAPVPDSGTRDADPTDVGDPIPPDTLRTSYVLADSYSSGGFNATAVTAGFYDQNPSPLSVSTETVGPCEVRSASLIEGGGFPRYANMGTLMIRGGLEDVSVPFGAGGYSPFSSDRALWNGGETLSFTNSGGSYGTFSAQVTAPVHVEITPPFVAIGSSLVVQRLQDLVVAWSGGAAGNVEVRLSGPQVEGMPFVSLTCSFTVGSGTGTIPAAALARIEPAGMGTIAADVTSSAEATLAGWGTVKVTANAAALGRGRWLHGADIR